MCVARAALSSCELANQATTRRKIVIGRQPDVHLPPRSNRRSFHFHVECLARKICFQGSCQLSHFILCSFDSSFHQHVSSSSTMTTDDDESYMQLALDVARRALDLGEVPVGCVIVWNQSPHGRVVVSHGANQVNATRDGAYKLPSQSSFRPAGSDTARQPHDTPSWSPSIACSRSRPRRTNSDSRQPFWPGPHAPTCCHLHRRCCCRMETNARKLGRIGSSSTRVTAGGPTMDFTQRQSWPSAIST